MSMKMKRSVEDAQHSTAGAGATETVAEARVDARNVLVSHGIHRGRFPIAGLRIREARQVLSRLINIDSGAVPVINGRPVDENTVIREDISMLSFVKPSSIKGQE